MRRSILATVGIVFLPPVGAGSAVVGYSGENDLFGVGAEELVRG